MFNSLRTASFCNLVDNEIDISKKDIFLIGKNGQGKTNFLEALYFCNYASSFRGIKDSNLARNGEKEFSVEVKLCSEGEYTKIFVKYEKLHKTITLDGKKIEDRKNILKISPCVVFCHEDMEFISNGQEKRRWFFDQTQSLYDPVYLDDFRKYRHVVKTRNSALRNYHLGFVKKHEILALLDVLDNQLADYGLRLMKKRRTAVKLFSDVFSSLYEKISGIGGINIKYLPVWKDITDTDTANNEILSLLEEKREYDLSQGVTLSGPHRDRYVFFRSANGYEDFSEKASTGQRRLLALLLRVAQARCFSVMTGKTPVLLLDDVLLELDGEKRKLFLSVMPEYKQAFFTFLPEEPYQKYCKGDTVMYYIKEGVLKLMEH